MRVCAKQLADDLFELVDCETKKEIDLRELAGPVGSVRGQRKPRKPSSYNIFIGDCVKKKSGLITKRFKECVIDWKVQKGKL